MDMSDTCEMRANAPCTANVTTPVEIYWPDHNRSESVGDMRFIAFERPMRPTWRKTHLEFQRAIHAAVCITSIATAVKISKGALALPTKFTHKPIPPQFRGDSGSEWEYVPEILDNWHGARPLCYSFGTQHHDEFTDFWTAAGCEVFAFDPTVSYYKLSNHPNLTFRSWGLRSAEDRSLEVHRTGDGNYGAISGELYSLSQIVSMLGHRGRSIAALKLDCEGCEFATFKELWCDPTLPPIMSINVEFHFRVDQRMVLPSDIERIRYVALYLGQHGFRSFQFATHAGTMFGYRGGPNFINPDLDAAGIKWDVCCYLHSFVNDRQLRNRTRS